MAEACANMAAGHMVLFGKSVGEIWVKVNRSMVSYNTGQWQKCVSAKTSTILLLFTQKSDG